MGYWEEKFRNISVKSEFGVVSITESDLHAMPADVAATDPTTTQDSSILSKLAAAVHTAESLPATSTVSTMPNLLSNIASIPAATAAVTQAATQAAAQQATTQADSGGFLGEIRKELNMAQTYGPYIAIGGLAFGSLLLLKILRDSI